MDLSPSNSTASLEAQYTRERHENEFSEDNQFNDNTSHSTIDETYVHETYHPSPSVRAIIQKYEPANMEAKIQIHSRPYKFFKQQTTDNINGKHKYISKQTIRRSSELDLLPNEGTYSVKLINKETIPKNIKDKNGIQVFEDIAPEFFPGNEYHPTNEQLKTYLKYRNNSGIVLIEKSSNTYACPRSSSKDKCVGTNLLATVQEIQSNSQKISNLPDTSYQSKTTISKIPNGVRIITDIFFDSSIDNNWKGSRIETDIPPSRILKEFQEKNTEHK